MDWVESNGGPLLLVPERYLRDWLGADGPTSGGTDYERACAADDYAAPIEVGRGQGIVLGDEPLPTSWRAGDRGGLLVRWIAAPSEDAITSALATLPEGLPWESVVDVYIEEDYGPLVLFDAAVPGAELPAEHLRFTLPAGRYAFELSAYHPSDDTALLLHRLRPAEKMSGAVDG